MAVSDLPRLSGAPWLQRPETQAVFAALAARSFAARAVGGAVRNALLGLPVTDVDIATTARPDEVVAAAEAAGLKAVPTGIAHGTVTIISGGSAYEVTTLRKDVETHGRHATVAFTDDWTADARRRDFTLNALYCSADGEVFDPLSGYADLMARRVRFIGDAGERIREDYLRILRFFRFTAAYGEGPPDRPGLDACVRERQGLAVLSGERMREEMLRLLAAPRGPELIAAMLDYGLIVAGAWPCATARCACPARRHPGRSWPGARCRSPSRGAGRRGSRGRGAPAGSPAAFQRGHGQACARIHTRACHRSRRSGERGKGLSLRARRGWLSRARAARVGPFRGCARERRLAPALGVARALAGADGFPSAAHDVMALGVPAGPRVGELLRTLEAWWIAGDFTADEAALRAKLGELAGAALGMSSARSPTNALVKVAFAAMALVSVLAGLGLYLLQARIGISEETARLVSTAFIVVGIADTIVLFLWDRIFKRGG